MPARIPFAASIAALMALIASLAGLAVMSGALREFARGPLVGEVRVDPVVLPHGVGLDPLEISEYLEAKLAERAERDVAVRMAFGPESSDKLMTIVIPRLVNSTVVGRMIEEIPPLKSVLALGMLRSSLRITVENRGAAPLQDVAMTLPGLVAAEAQDGAALETVALDNGTGAVRLGALEARQIRTIAAWLTLPPAAPEIGAGLALGAAGGYDGQLVVYAGERWVGEDLGAYGWARWLVGGILLAVAFGAFGVLAVIAGRLWQARHPAVRPA